MARIAYVEKENAPDNVKAVYEQLDKNIWNGTKCIKRNGKQH